MCVYVCIYIYNNKYVYIDSLLQEPGGEDTRKDKEQVEPRGVGYYYYYYYYYCYYYYYYYYVLVIIIIIIVSRLLAPMGSVLPTG